MASEIAVALISGGVGLATGAVGSLFAPWANWGVEKRRTRQDRRSKRIEVWRSGVAALHQAEELHSPVIRSPIGILQIVDDNPSDHPDTDVSQQTWFLTLQSEMSEQVSRTVRDLMTTRLKDRKTGRLPALLDVEISRIERDEWKLV